MATENFIRDYWKQIDLHSHTLRGVDCKGNGDSANYKHSIFRKNIIDAGTQLQAVTNHNTLYIEDHIKHAIICNLIGVEYIPGVELDIKLKGKQKPFHCVFLLAPKNDICEFSKRLNSATNQKRLQNEVFYDEEEVSRLFANMHFIYVVHGIKKKGLAENQKDIELDRENIDWVCNAIKNALAEPVLFENTRPQNVFAFANRFREFTDREDIIDLTMQQVTTSDYKFDNDSERLQKWLDREKFAICAEPTYEGLELSIRHYHSRFQLVSEIVEPVTFLKKIRFERRKDEKFCVGGEIECSPYFNVIIGNSGTGKTLLLNEIYRSITSKNLDAVLVQDNKLKENESAYGSYIGKQDFIKSYYYNDKNPKVVEIDKIYKKLLNANNPTEIAGLFNVSVPKKALDIIFDYQKKVSNYETCLEEHNSFVLNGAQAFESIKSNCQFIANNPLKKRSFSLKREVFDDSEIKKLSNAMVTLAGLINQKSAIEGWVKEASKFIPDANKEVVDGFNSYFNSVLKLLTAELAKTDLKIKKEKIIQTIINHYNNSIDAIGKTIGNKQSAVDKASTTILEQRNVLRDCVKGAITTSLSKSTFSLDYPFDKITKNVKSSQNDNKYARISANYLNQDKFFSFENLRDSRIIDINNLLTKIKKAIGNGEYNLSRDEDVKSVIDVLLKSDIRLSTLLKIEIPFVTQIYDNDDWKNAVDINPGNLAKRYMTYYFNNTLDTERPNIVFIDQPENDVDKSFISTVLAKFITDHKISVQFFITSHEPILGVNADSNLLIESYRDGSGRICYRSKNFESIASSPNDESGKETASRILDGGKKNVILRNQIYGGSIDD